MHETTFKFSVSSLAARQSCNQCVNLSFGRASWLRFSYHVRGCFVNCTPLSSNPQTPPRLSGSSRSSLTLNSSGRSRPLFPSESLFDREQPWQKAACIQSYPRVAFGGVSLPIGRMRRSRSGNSGSRRRPGGRTYLFHSWWEEDRTVAVRKREEEDWGGRRRRRRRREKMPEDLVCKFPRCISVGSCRDPWRINGPARMKGRGRAGEEVGEDRCSLYLIPFTFMYLSSFLSLSLSRKRIVDAAGCSRALRPSIRSVRPNRGPPNKRSFRSRAARLERTSKKRRDRGVPSLSASGTKLAQWTCIPSSVAPIRLSLDRLPIVLARAAQLRQPEKDRDQKRGCTVSTQAWKKLLSTRFFLPSSPSSSSSSLLSSSLFSSNYLRKRGKFVRKDHTDASRRERSSASGSGLGLPDKLEPGGELEEVRRKLFCRRFLLGTSR